MSATRPRVLCLGSLVLDMIAVVERLPGEDERLEADHLVLAGGGNASTAAVAMARLGVPVDFAGVVGDDEAGRLVLDGLAAEGVGIDHVEVRADVETGASVVVSSTATATRTIITRPAVLPSRIPDGYEWLHVDKVGHGALRSLGGTTARVSLDDGNPVPYLDLRLVDLYVPTVQVLRARYREQDAVAAARAAAAQGARVVVATDGSRGSFALEDRLVAYAPALPVVPLSSLGAGDVFHGALLAGLVLGQGVADAIRLANVTAALSCRAVDGRSGIPGRGEVEQALSGLPRIEGDHEALVREVIDQSS